ncbi:MAG: hypothetical protein EZS28_017623 [Streblomastix strix]|uniref:Uncharacterized protein n=1 Tax=Streblomastix strix TaxID=222440 RepID=A0A5J4VX41_9EUKA|nr:MAG: hypothetical protein EZS28_017623 [Streblomastix strix]
MASLFFPDDQQGYFSVADAQLGPNEQIDDTDNNIINQRDNSNNSNPATNQNSKKQLNSDKFNSFFTKIRGEPKPIDALVVEWLHMQNPLEEWADQQNTFKNPHKNNKIGQNGSNFSFNAISGSETHTSNSQMKKTGIRPRLPGQRLPGLGVGFGVSRMLIDLAAEMKQDCIINMPEHFHNAYLYKEYFRFINPMFEAFFQTLLSDLLPDINRFGLATVAFCVSMGLVVDSCYDLPSQQVADMMKQRMLLELQSEQQQKVSRRQNKKDKVKKKQSKKLRQRNASQSSFSDDGSMKRKKDKIKLKEKEKEIEKEKELNKEKEKEKETTSKMSDGSHRSRSRVRRNCTI